MSSLLPTFTDLIERDGWSLQPDRHTGPGFTHCIEKEGLCLTYSADPSGLYQTVSVQNGGWGYIGEVLDRVGLVPDDDLDGFSIIAQNADAVKSYLLSWRWKADVRESRRARMENLRRFQREHGMTELWLAGEEDLFRLRAVWKRQIIGWRGLQYWGVAVVAALYLIYWVASAKDTVMSLMIVAVGFAMVGSGLLALRIRQKF